jgi:hypothetical protein
MGWSGRAPAPPVTFGKNFLTLLQHWSGAVSVRPICAADVAADHNALRGSGPNRKHAFKDALIQAGFSCSRFETTTL